MLGSIHMKNDQQLATMLKQQDLGTLSVIYDKYAPALFGIISRITTNEKLAEDILHNSFVKVWKQTGSFNADRHSLFTWLIHFARQLAFDAIKTNQAVNPIGTLKVYKNNNGLTDDAAFDLLYYKGVNYSEAIAASGVNEVEFRNNLKITIQKMVRKNAAS